MKYLALSLLCLGLLSACGGENTTPSAISAPATSTPQAENSAAVYLKRRSDTPPYTINEKGIVQFGSLKDMFDTFGDYDADGQLKINSPTDVRIAEFLPKNASKDDITAAANKALIYAVYHAFAYTNLDKITVRSAPMDIDTSKPLMSKPLQATVSRERALEVLKKYSAAQSFDDLVELNPSYTNRITGFSSSNFYDAFAYDSAHQKDIIQALTAPTK